MKKDKTLFVIRYLGTLLAMCLAVSILFYNSLIGMAVLTPYLVYRLSGIGAEYRKKQRRIILNQFKDFLSNLETAILAGNSAGMAVIAAKKDVEAIYGASSPLVKCLDEVENRLSINESLSNALQIFMEKSDLKEIMDFCEVFIVANSSGGDLTALIRAARNNIYETINLNREIEDIISGNKTECLIMKVMPLLILLYFRVFSSSFLTPLYYTTGGKAVMLVLSAVYCIMIEYSNIIVDRINS
ncbi:MAG: hypothetical protein PUB67_06030 [Clostridiales bacterium]|nr:hypothetical protein [Clostridiales bacterium]